WNPVAGATRYSLRITRTPETTGTVVHNGSSTTTTYSTNLTSTGTYYWWIQTVNGSLISDWSEPVQFVVTPLSAPALVSPENGYLSTNRAMTFDWEPVAGASYYTIQISPNSNFSPYPTEINTNLNTSYTTTLSNGIVGYWRVRAYSGTYLGGTFSEVRQLTIPALQIPTLVAPPNLAVQYDNDVVFSWSSVQYATEYDLQISNNSIFTSILHETTLADTSYTYSLTNGNGYYWRVRAKDQYGNVTGWSSHRMVTINPLPAPTLIAPINESGTDEAWVTFSWDSVPEATNYQIQIATDSAFVTIIDDHTGTALTYLDSFINANTYYWRVRARINTLNGEWSLMRQFDTHPLPAPILGLPVDTFATDNSTIAFSWDVVTDATSYHIQIATDSGFNTIVADETVATNSHTQFVAGLGTYYWRVQAKNNQLNGVWSVTHELTITPPLPDAPNPIAPMDGLITTTITHEFSWDVVTDISSYQLQISTDNTFTTTTYDLSLVTNLHSQNFSAVGTYYWRVRAKNGNLDSDWSAVRQLIINRLPAPMLLSPENLYTTTAIDVLFVWDAVQNATDYQIQVGYNTNFIGNIRDVTLTNTQVSLYLNKAPLYWRVRAIHNGMAGDWSEVRQLTLLHYDAPVLISPTTGATATQYVNLSWEPVE
ncbi:MAG TPA: hypothetical protein PLZ51_15705, partial [Aggregatilineales bacterium]|nr:hypothetical protein [Aggregatilineales bacterium]